MNSALPKSVITIDVSGNRPHIGKTLIAGIVARALADVGFTKVTVNAPEGGVDEAAHNIVERTVKPTVLENEVVINDLNAVKRLDQSAQIIALAADLTQAAATLRGYEMQHRAKGTVESSEKAEVNAALATRFEATLAGLSNCRPPAINDLNPSPRCIAFDEKGLLAAEHTLKALVDSASRNLSQRGMSPCFMHFDDSPFQSSLEIPSPASSRNRTLLGSDNLPQEGEVAKGIPGPDSVQS